MQADLDLLIKPEILEFKDINAAVEEPAKWEVIIKSNPKPDLIWERDGVVLDDEERFGAEEEYKNRKYRLVMKKVEYEDAGTYKVTAKNYLGEDSAEAQLIPYSESQKHICHFFNLYIFIYLHKYEFGKNLTFERLLDKDFVTLCKMVIEVAYVVDVATSTKYATFMTNVLNCRLN